MTPRTKTYLAMDMIAWAKSLEAKGIGSIDTEMVKVEYVPGAESNLRCLVKVTDFGVGGEARFYSITLREVT